MAKAAPTPAPEVVEEAPVVEQAEAPVAPAEPFAEEKAAALAAGAAVAYVIESPNPGVSPALRIDN